MPYNALARRAPGVRSARTEAADVLALNPGETVVEISCGTGVNLPYLAKHVDPEGSAIVVDFSPGVLGVTRKQTRESPQVHLVHGDVTWPPVVRGLGVSPTTVLVIFVSGIFGDPAAMVSSWVDLVGPDGRLCLVGLTGTTDSRWRPLGPVLRVFVRVTTPPESRTIRALPTRLLNQRLVAVHRALESRCRVTHETAHAFGFVRVCADVVE